MPEDRKADEKLTAIVSEDTKVRGIWDSLRDRRVEKTEIDINQLTANVNVFVNQIASVIEQAPSDVGKFQLSEIEVFAEISGKGQVILLGVGGEVGASGGIKFVFRKK